MMADDMYGGDLPEDALNEELDADGVAVAPSDAAHRQYEEAQSEIDQLKKRLVEMEAEAALLKDSSAPQTIPASRMPAHPHHLGHVPGQSQGVATVGMEGVPMQEDVGPEKEAELQAAKEEIDSRSVYVGGVDYATSPEELQVHFQGCGTINRLTILTDRYGSPKGYAYVEFLEPDAVRAAVALTDTEIHGRKIKVTPKRTNLPGLKGGRGRGRGMYGRGFFGRGYYGGWYPPPTTYLRGRGRGGRIWYSPY